MKTAWERVFPCQPIPPIITSTKPVESDLKEKNHCEGNRIRLDLSLVYITANTIRDWDNVIAALQDFSYPSQSDVVAGFSFQVLACIKPARFIVPEPKNEKSVPSRLLFQQLLYQHQYRLHIQV